MAERAFVTALSGIPGSGKTTLLELLLRDYPQAQPVLYDRFDPGMTDEQIQAWFRRGGDPNEFTLSELIGELTRRTRMPPGATRRPLVLFETAFGRVHRATGAFIDFQIWIDTPLDLAMARANLAFLDNARRNPAPNAAADFMQWLTRYMQDYPILRRTYVAVSEQAAATADLVLDGTQPPEVLAASARAALAARGMPP
jgi:uridine kinase